MVEGYNKYLYKVFLILVKYLPMALAVIYFIAGICGCFGVQLIAIPNIFFLSPVTAGFLVLTSFVFKCCI